MAQFNFFLFKPYTYGKASLILLLCVYGTVAFSQKDLLPQADKLFNEKRYSEAIPLYDKAYEKKKERPVLLKLADANFLNENYPQAQKYYAEYFRDTVYENIPQFGSYARSSRISGKIPLAVKLYQKMYEMSQEAEAKTIADTYKLYVDSSAFTRSFNLDSNYKCVTIDATQSLDTLAPPMLYSWEFDDGITADGLRTEHCFTTIGDHSVILNITDKKSGRVRQRDTMLVVHIDELPVTFKAPGTAKRYFYVDFEANEPSLPDYEIIDYLWDMDNGETAIGKKIKYKYNNSRDYWVKLTVIARNKTTGRRELFSANKRVEVVENYETPNKKFSDALNGSK